ncbi:LysE/ArgO family amino acid transporter [Bacillus methanolicus]|uniref:Amino-acid transporter YisU n=1 Tax=Bacillus methanolicus (strain MGA3 / ATCC 53907) TaxID=796606 RepID=I3E9C3_BACMM|nr:LysE/ArgO family amino acid transporter [Bacillus methanolicus]AIE60343.1 Putative amino-acid transporter YisU [Bacillus methanolicus MGA3]EIJ83094.1 amino acid transporter LysE [Bacillus methanolicus MGA3]
MAEAFIHGFILAFGLILPLGVQNVFVFNQGAFHKRFIYALPVVLTASLCDTLLIALAVFGVSVVILGSFWIKTILMCAGIVFLLYMGSSIWKSTPENSNNENMAKENFTRLKQIAFSASVSLLNPHAILDTIGVIGTSSLSYTGSEKIVFTVACIMVSWVWFLSLAIAGRIVGNLDTQGNLLQVINKISAILIWGVAIYIGVQLYHSL